MDISLSLTNEFFFYKIWVVWSPSVMAWHARAFFDKGVTRQNFLISQEAEVQLIQVVAIIVNCYFSIPRWRLNLEDDHIVKIYPQIVSSTKILRSSSSRNIGPEPSWHHHHLQKLWFFLFVENKFGGQPSSTFFSNPGENWRPIEEDKIFQKKNFLSKTSSLRQPWTKIYFWVLPIPIIFGPNNNKP